MAEVAGFNDGLAPFSWARLGKRGDLSVEKRSSVAPCSLGKASMERLRFDFAVEDVRTRAFEFRRWLLGLDCGAGWPFIETDLSPLDLSLPGSVARCSPDGLTVADGGGEDEGAEDDVVAEVQAELAADTDADAAVEGGLESCTPGEQQLGREPGGFGLRSV